MIDINLQNKLQHYKQQGKTIVLVTGVFDLLHSEHKKFLTRAWEQGNILIVGIESDARVKEMKGKGRPIWNQEKRKREIEKYLKQQKRSHQLIENNQSKLVQRKVNNKELASRKTRVSFLSNGNSDSIKKNIARYVPTNTHHSTPHTYFTTILPTNFSNPQIREDFIATLQPDILAVSSHSLHTENKRNIIEKHGGELRVVLPHNPNISTTKMVGDRL